MSIGVLTTIGNERYGPEERGDKWREAISCYEDLADEVVIVSGNKNFKYESEKTRTIYCEWKYEWCWVQLPKSLNAGREQLTTEWCLKVDIDQFFHEKDFDQIRKKLAECPKDIQVATFQKISMAYGGKYYQKGGQPIAFRNNPGIVIGKNLDKETDLCFAIRQTGVEGCLHLNSKTEEDEIYNLPIGRDLPIFRTGISYWNYDYFFKTKEFTKKEFWRFSRAHYKYFGDWTFGNSEEESFKHFLSMQKGRHDRSPYTYKLEDHPKYIREAVKDLTPESFGFDGWGLI